MPKVPCPSCAEPVDLVEAQPVRPLAPSVDGKQLPALVPEGSTRALWSAVRCLEDAASAARWQLTQADPPPYLQGVIDSATDEAAVLRDVLRRWAVQDDAAEQP